MTSTSGFDPAAKILHRRARQALMARRNLEFLRGLEDLERNARVGMAIAAQITTYSKIVEA